jgi:predicted RNase H-like HicB family nuclease
MPEITFSLQFPLRVVIYPAPDVKNQWIAHCLETDVVTQGDSVKHAFKMMAEALGAISKINLSHGRFPVILTPAPKEVWDLVDIEKPSGIIANVEIAVKGIKKKEPQMPDSLPLYAFISKHAPHQHNAR